MLVLDLFNLLTYLTRVGAEQFEAIQDELVRRMVEALDSLVPHAFVALDSLLNACLKSVGSRAVASTTDEEQDIDDEDPEALLRQKISADVGQAILKYLSVFLLPLIKSVHRSAEIFEGDQAKTMQILSKLIQLLPLSKQDAQERLLTLMGDKVAQGIEFLGMFTQKKMQSESLPLLIAPETELRDYQKQGIQWMRQLGRYGLNCCLCDEMGLGKTIQSLSVVINESEVLKQQ